MCCGWFVDTPSVAVSVLWVVRIHTISSCVCIVGDVSLCSGLYMHCLQLRLCCGLSLCSNLYSERLYTPSAFYELILLFMGRGGVGIKLLKYAGLLCDLFYFLADC